MVVGGRLAAEPPRKYLNYLPPALHVAVLVKSKRGSVVLVKARKKKRAKGRGGKKTERREDRMYQDMWHGIYGSDGGRGEENLFSNINSQNRKEARGKSGKQLTTFMVPVWDPSRNGFARHGASNAELQMIINMGNIVNSMGPGYEEIARPELEKEVKKGRITQGFMDDILDGKEGLRDSISRFANLAREGTYHRNESRALQGKKKLYDIDSETGKTTSLNTWGSQTDFQPYEPVHVQENPHHVPYDGDHLSEKPTNVREQGKSSMDLLSQGPNVMEDTMGSLNQNNGDEA